MKTVEAWELLCSRPEWVRRCQIIAHHYRDHPDWGARALADYAHGKVTRDLEEGDDFWEAAGLEDEDIDWGELLNLFSLMSRDF